MAYVETRYCYSCEANQSHLNGQCSCCREKERKADMMVWKAQTIEDKLLDLHKRLLAVEAGPTRY